MITFAEEFEQPLSDWQQAQLFLWLRQTLSEEQRTSMRANIPDVARCILGPDLVYGIPLELFDTLRDLAVNQQKRIQAIKELRHATGWDLKEAKHFIDEHFG